jgi:hypothetical protein
MPFLPAPGGKGLIFVPPVEDFAKKHDCRDCFYCQQCSDDRCLVCRAGCGCASSRPDDETKTTSTET